MFPDDENSFEEVYSGEAREDMVDNDEISAEEEAFMKGYDEDQEATDKESLEEQRYEDAFEKKSRKRKPRESFDEEEIEAEVLMQ